VTSRIPRKPTTQRGSAVLTAFGRFNGGTIRGDKKLADRFLGMFFRI
jgi:hypothetical protein